MVGIPGILARGEKTEPLPRLALQNNPKLMRDFAVMCQRWTIDPVPVVFLSHYENGTAALVNDQQITLGARYLKEPDNQHALAALACETARILFGDARAGAENNVVADRAAALLLGDKAPVLALLSARDSAQEGGFEQFQKSYYGHDNGRIGRLGEATEAEMAQVKHELHQRIVAYNARAAAHAR